MGHDYDNPLVRSYRDLAVWNKAMDLAAESYALSRQFPKDEMYGMTSQLRRAAVSVAANIAEGHGRDGTASFINFLRIAQGSLKETETHLLLCERVGLVASEQTGPLLKLSDDLGRMIRGLIRSLQAKLTKESEH